MGTAAGTAAWTGAGTGAGTAARTAAGTAARTLEDISSVVTLVELRSAVLCCVPCCSGAEGADLKRVLIFTGSDWTCCTLYIGRLRQDYLVKMIRPSVTCGLSQLTTKRWRTETQAATGLTLLPSPKRMTKAHSAAGLTVLTIHRIVTLSGADLALMTSAQGGPRTKLWASGGPMVLLS